MEDVICQHGNETELMNSIKQKLIVLPEDTLIYPGHGNPGIVLEERNLYN